MPDREKVKAALRCCIVRNPDDKMRCPECPYRDPGTFCLNRLKIDALALLEASENSECGPDYCDIKGDSK